jgi:hypothetical protein
MNRRSALKYFVIISAGTAMLPSCKPGDKKLASPYDHLPVNEDQQQLISEIAGTIIPEEGGPGSKTVAAPTFALQMLNDCYEQEDRDKFMEGMKEFASNVKNKYDKSFVECSSVERQEFIDGINDQKDLKDKATFFYTTLKELTIKGYTNSEYYLTKIQVYKQVPGKFKANVSGLKT